MAPSPEAMKRNPKLAYGKRINRKLVGRGRSHLKLLDRLIAPRKHEKVIRSFFGEKCVYSENAASFPHPLYLLAFSNRTGSNLLAEYLRSTNVFSGFGEQLNHQSVLALSKTLGAVSFPDYLAKVTAKFGNDKSIYGFKASWSQLLMLLRCRIDRMYTGIKIIHLTRTDAVAQAVSFSIASQTKRWTSLQNGEVANPQFDFDDINMRLDASLLSAEAIAATCSLFMIPRLHLCYEELTKDPRGTMLKVGEFCGFDFHSWQPEQSVLAKQGGTINGEYVLKFSDTARKLILSGATGKTL
jgi:trehalose 2-sulfotransferase